MISLSSILLKFDLHFYKISVQKPLKGTRFKMEYDVLYGDLTSCMQKIIYDNQEPCDKYYPESSEQNTQRVTRLCFMNIYCFEETG